MLFSSNQLHPPVTQGLSPQLLPLLPRNFNTKGEGGDSVQIPVTLDMYLPTTRTSGCSVVLHCGHPQSLTEEVTREIQHHPNPTLPYYVAPWPAYSLALKPMLLE
jgi:hypothetical protein